MRTASIIATAATALAGSASAVGVSGTAEGFAASTTGGGSATPVYPADIDELVSYLGDDQARVIVLDTTFDFTGSEGTVTETGCAPWGTGSACQTAINQNDWCTNYEPDAPSVSVTYDVAGVEGITVGSNKSLIGVGSSGVIKGKGLRMANGVSNVIIQNIHITDLNPQYVWGGDAITLDGTDLIWIDHVKTSLIGRQHIVLGTGASQRVTISNNEIDGTTDWSATCDGQHYWNLYFTGSSDLVTFKGNYIHNFSGRAPKVGGTGNSLIHAVNNYFYSSTGHAFEISTGGMVLAEGNLFQDVADPLDPGNAVTGQLFSSPDSSTNAVCSTYLGRSCVVNSLSSSGTFYGDNEDFLVDFEGKNIASASAASSSPVSNAGIGKI